MEIRNNKQPIDGSQPRRFSAGRATGHPGGSSFAAALKKAASDAKGPSEAKAAAEAHATPTDSSPAVAGAPGSPVNASEPGPAANPPAKAEGQPANPEAAASGAESDAAFADHMELVRFRLKTGYYASKAINDALSDKLSGYFDELA